MSRMPYTPASLDVFRENRRRGNRVLDIQVVEVDFVWQRPCPWLRHAHKSQRGRDIGMSPINVA